MAEAKLKSQITVDKLRPGTSGHNLTVKVLSTKQITQKGPKLAECLVGDDTGLIIFTARGDHQVDMMKEGSSVNIQNAKVDLFKGSMRVALDRGGKVEPTEPVSFTVKEDNNLSLIEFEMVSVVEN